MQQDVCKLSLVKRPDWLCLSGCMRAVAEAGEMREIAVNLFYMLKKCLTGTLAGFFSTLLM